jgi:hypothetical protein
MRVIAASALAFGFAPCSCFPVKFSAKDCGASAGHYQSFDVAPSTPKTGEVFKVTNHFSFDEDVSGGQFDVKVSALGGIPLKHQTGPLCGIDTSYDVYLAVVKVASVTIYGSTCPMAKGPADITYDVKLLSILPPGLGDAAFHLTAKDQKGRDILCVQAHLGIQLENEDNAEAEMADNVMEALKMLSPPVSSSARSISLKHSDCGGKGSHAPIVDFNPSAIALGTKTTMVGHGKLDETVASAKFELTMTSPALGTMLHCSGDASQTKSCPLPMGFGSLTMQGMSFPLAPGTVPVNVDIYLKESTPTDLLTTTTTAKASDEKGEEIFCIQIDSTPTAAGNADVVV